MQHSTANAIWCCNRNSTVAMSHQVNKQRPQSNCKMNNIATPNKKTAGGTKCGQCSGNHFAMSCPLHLPRNSPKSWKTSSALARKQNSSNARSCFTLESMSTFSVKLQMLVGTTHKSHVTIPHVVTVWESEKLRMLFLFHLVLLCQNQAIANSQAKLKT